MKQKLAIILEYGFHDVKKYIHSGLVKELGCYFDIVWIALDKQNSTFDDYFKNTGYPLIFLKDDQIVSYDSKLNGYNQTVRRSWMVNNDLGLFHNYSIVRTKSLKTIFFGNPLFKIIFEYLTLQQIKKFENSNLTALYQQHKIDKILFTGYSSTFVKNIVATAIKKDIPTYCIVNSWKDLYVNNFVPFRSNTRFFVWDEQMKKDYLYHMPYLKKNNIIAAGNPTFDYLIGSIPKFDRIYYSQKYSISKVDQWIYYTMMPPGIVDDEIQTILFIAHELLVEFGTEFIILIRRNPNHKPDEFSILDLPANVRLTEHYCLFDKEKDLLIQTEEGEREWLDLLHHTGLNFSVPSTVTKECMILGIPVFNIAFNQHDLVDSRLQQYFDAGFYKNLFQVNGVYMVKSINQLIQHLKDINLSKKTIFDNSVKSSASIISYLKSD